MNNNSHPRELKEKHILPFPVPAESVNTEERLTRMEVALCRLAAHLGLSLENVPAPAPVSVPLAMETST